MYLIDTVVVSEIRKRDKTNPGVREFFDRVRADNTPCYLSVITVGELRHGVELIRHRGDTPQAAQLETWLETILLSFESHLLPIDSEIAQLWGRLGVPHYEHAIDKLVAATALIHQLTVVTRNVSDFETTGVVLLNPFS